MKKVTLLSVSFLLVSFLFTSCFLGGMGEKVNGEGDVRTESRTVKTFTGVEASRGLEVNIQKGDAIAVEVVADDNLHELIKTEVTGNVLKIYSNKNIGKAQSKVINVTVTALNELDASSGSRVTVAGTIESEEFDIDLSSGANISIDLASSKVSCDASSGAYINLSGQLGQFEAETSSGANMKIKDVTTTKTSLELVKK